MRFPSGDQLGSSSLGAVPGSTVRLLVSVRKIVIPFRPTPAIACPSGDHAGAVSALAISLTSLPSSRDEYTAPSFSKASRDPSGDQAGLAPAAPARTLEPSAFATSTLSSASKARRVP